MNGKYHRRTVSGLKVCPKCKGKGEVPVPLGESQRIASQEWAQSFDGKVVRCDGVCGVARAERNLGGGSCAYLL